MGQIEKIIKDIMRHPKVYPFSDVERVLNHFGYNEFAKGKTSGSRIAYVRQDGRVIMFHKPHDKEIKKSSLDDIVDALERNGDIK